MRVVLSRKGFDSTAGGGPSPLLPDGRLFSLPIPERRPTPAAPDYEELGLAALMRSLGYADGPAHLDPDLLAGRRKREPGWRGVFGQVNAAASHLLRHDVGAGDLFLFFGLFRRVEKGPKGYSFVRGARPFHAIWGYLEVDVRLDSAASAPDWARDHAHVANPSRGTPNLVYLAREHRFGAFRYRDQLRLTRAGAARVTDWLLPSSLDGVPLSYHPGRARSGTLRAASRGQEFVWAPRDAVASWARRLVAESECWTL